MREERRQITDTDIEKLSTTQKKTNNAKQQNKISLVQKPLDTPLGQETRWAYSTMLPSLMRPLLYLYI